MALLPIFTYPDPVLSKKAEKVTDFGPDTQKFFDDMIETMHVEDGVGLAAPQVGVSRQILVLSPRARRGEEMILVNPEIYESSGQQLGAEGCLSFPGVSGEVMRATRIRVRYQDRHGQSVDSEFKDFTARVIQHENDHLNGILLVDRVSFSDRQKLLDEYQKI